MSGFSYIDVSCPNRGSFIAFASKAQKALEKWNAKQNDSLKGLFQSMKDGVLIELVEGQQSYWYSLSRDPSQEKVSRIVELMECLRSLEAVQSLNVGMAHDGENELNASRNRIELDEASSLLDLERKQWKQNSCFQFPKYHLYHFEGVDVKLNEPTEAPDGQEAVGFFTDYWVTARDPETAWQILSDYFVSENYTCSELGDTQQVEFPEDYEGETIWYGSRIFYSKD